MEFFNRVGETENAVVLTFHCFDLNAGRLLNCQTAINEEIKALIEKRKSVVLDFWGAFNIQHSSLGGILVAFDQRLQAFSCRLALCKVDQNFTEYLKKHNLLDPRILNIFPSRETALSFLQEKATPS